MTPGDRAVQLTARELEVLSLVAEGLSDAQIGQALNLSPKTVNYHVEKIKRTLLVSNRIQAVVFALRRGMIF